jgi:transcriptional regulator with GAF, ATPase, and Fis domain
MLDRGPQGATSGLSCPSPISYSPPKMGHDSPIKQVRDAAERGYLAELLERHAWNVTAAAKEAKIHRLTLTTHARRLGLERPAEVA